MFRSFYEYTSSLSAGISFLQIFFFPNAFTKINAFISNTISLFQFISFCYNYISGFSLLFLFSFFFISSGMMFLFSFSLLLFCPFRHTIIFNVFPFFFFHPRFVLSFRNSRAFTYALQLQMLLNFLLFSFPFFFFLTALSRLFPVTKFVWLYPTPDRNCQCFFAKEEVS